MSLEISPDNMSSLGLDNQVGWSPRSARERVLMQLKMAGERTASALGAELGTSAEAARQLLVKLAEEGLVASRSTSSGVGRPAQYWSLTAAGNARFPDTHAALTVELIATLREAVGVEALDRVIGAREERIRRGYFERLAGIADLGARVAALAEIRSEEGYMAESHVEPDGSHLLVENHCPICAAATACQQFCRSELAIFSAALGEEVHIVRTDHIVAGARRCAYRITPA